MEMEKKKKKKLSPNPSLPDELVVIIMARVSRFYYPKLSLVSKRFRSLIASQELYKVRSLLGSTEICIYLCFHCCPGFQWLTLRRKLNQTSEKKKSSSGYVLATLSFPQSSKQFSNLVVVGSDIYSIGKLTINYDQPSSKVSVLDCRSHTWRREAPRMKVEPTLLTTGVIDRKIYVAGYHNDDENPRFRNFFEVFDTVTQIWDPEPILCSESDGKFCTRSACFDGKFHVVTNKDMVAYDSKQRKWDLVGRTIQDHMFSSAYCVIHNVLYSVTEGSFRWYDSELRLWRRLLGLVGLPKFPLLVSIVLVDYGGKMMVFWDDWELYYKLDGDYLKLIWCAEITLERPNSNEIWGTVEWFDIVLEVPNKYEFVNVVAATL